MSCKDRRFVYLSGVTARTGLGVYNADVSSAEMAIKERYLLVKTDQGFKPPLQPVRGCYQRVVPQEFFRKVTGCFRARAHSLLSTARLYAGPKQQVYLKAYESLMVHPIMKKDSWLKMFVKFEKQDLTKAPRCINPRGPRYTLMLARYLKRIEKPLYKRINRAFGDEVVVKGLNAHDTASVIRRKWDLFDDPVAVGVDATKFDMHVSVPALKYEHSFYEQIFQSKELTRLLSWQTQNKGVAWCPDGKLVFSMPGTRASGDINTSMGNVLIMCTVLYVLKTRFMKISFINNGDDSVILVERVDVQRLLDLVPVVASDYGFRMKVEEPVDQFEKLEFCQARPVFVGGDWRMVRNLSTCLIKDGMCLTQCDTAKALRKWMFAVGVCNSILNEGVPVLQSMALWFKRHGHECGRAMMELVFRNTSMFERIREIKRGAVIDDNARASFYTAFDILPDAQIELEEYFDRLTFSESFKEDEVNLNINNFPNILRLGLADI